MCYASAIQIDKALPQSRRQLLNRRGLAPHLWSSLRLYPASRSLSYWIQPIPIRTSYDRGGLASQDRPNSKNFMISGVTIRFSVKMQYLTILEHINGH